LRELADDPEFQNAFRLAKQQNKRRLADLIARCPGVSVDPQSLFDVQVKRVHDAVLAACDAQDGLADGIVSDPVACQQRFDVGTLRCTGGAGGAN